MTPRMLVASGLFRNYRPVLLFFWSTMVLGAAITGIVLRMVTEPTFSPWLMVAGSASKYWLGAVGVMLVSTHLRQFVANGFTRRDFMAGAAIFGLLAAALFALLVPVGHGIEQTLLSLGGPLPADYGAISVQDGLREFGYQLPGELAFLVTGAVAAAGFYRFGVGGGLLLLIPALLPAAVAEGLFGIDSNADIRTRFVPYAAALLISLVVTALGALLFQRELRHVAIHRTAG